MTIKPPAPRNPDIGHHDMFWTLSAFNWVIGVLAVGFVFTCLLMMLVILIQKPKGGGLSGAFGGAGGGSAQAAFGAKVGDVLTWLTVGFFVAFLLLAMGLTWTINPSAIAADAAAQQASTENADEDAAASAEDDQAPAAPEPAQDADDTTEGTSEPQATAAPQTQPSAESTSEPAADPADADEDAATAP